MKYLFLVIQLLILHTVYAQNPLEKDPWSKKQLMEPSHLINLLNNNKIKPIILNIGVENNIKGAIKVGAAKHKVNLTKLENEIKKYPKNALIVLYCGCCPFDKCPNIRPAFSILSKNKYKQFYLLHLPHNIRTDYIEKGFPMASN